MTTSNHMKKHAKISPDGKYRYNLSRIWDEEKPKILFIMLNPATADDTVDDPTIRRVINYAKDWGYGGVFVGNLYAFRSKSPKDLRNIDNPMGENNIQEVYSLLELVEKVIYAWGNKKKEPSWLRERVDTPYCIDVGINGIPKHPLRLKLTLKCRLYERNS
tara:strand:+ start:40 stop:522 length:483 start_codon:yes stop_codon:yes gene_type:complete